MKIRLQNGSSLFEGRIEIYTGSQWNSVCDSSFSTYDAKAVCASLGVRYTYCYINILIVDILSKKDTYINFKYFQD